MLWLLFAPIIVHSVYTWRGLVVSLCLLCNDPRWHSHSSSFHLSLLWSSLMLNVPRMCIWHIKVWPKAILAHSILATSDRAPQKTQTLRIFACLVSRIKVRTCTSRHLDAAVAWGSRVWLDDFRAFPPVIKHGWLCVHDFPIKTSIYKRLSVAMFDYQRVRMFFGCFPRKELDP